MRDCQTCFLMNKFSELKRPQVATFLFQPDLKLPIYFFDYFAGMM